MRATKVLLVNEPADDIAIYSEMLHRMGYEVLTASGAEEAVRVAAAARPSVIVTDVCKRTKHGWRTPEVLKTDPRTGSIPVVVLTGWVFPEDRARAYASGADLFLEKPVPPTRLVREIHACLARNENPT